MMSGNVKTPTTIDQQIETLEKRGLVIYDKPKAKDTLSALSYYTLSGYLHEFKTSEDNYAEGLSFETVLKIYEFDRKFRNILSYAIETIEHTLKAKISYHFAHEYGALDYLSSNNFRNGAEHNLFLKKLYDLIHTNRNIPFVKHHNSKYGGQFPIWVAVEIFTMGMLYNFYKNLNTYSQKKIAKEFNTGVRQLLSWIENINYTRNMVAHYMRMYNFRVQKTPIKCLVHNCPAVTSYKIFDVVQVMKVLILDKNEWNSYILRCFSAVFEEYKDCIDINRIGFPKDWECMLTV